MREWGFLGGSFDPIHFGHINVAVQMAEVHKLEKILLCPAAVSPSKVSSPPMGSKEDRYKMAKLATEEIPYIEVLDLEINRPGPSFSIDTIQALQKKLPKDVQIRLIIAEDLWESFFDWKEAQLLAKIAPPLIASRKCYSTSSEAVEKTMLLHLEISSTYIRKRLANKLYCGHLVPHKALDYIEQHKLYE